MTAHVFPSVSAASSVLSQWVKNAQKVVVLSGAGISAESGVPTFRDAHTGFWQNYDVEQLATAAAWEADPQLVYSWYLWRARMVRSVTPNAGHTALAHWEQRANIYVSTQNVDDLHERAGSAQVSHLHGSLYKLRCDECDYSGDLSQAMLEGHAAPGSDDDMVLVAVELCPDCAVGRLRPDIVFFGEFLPQDQWQRTEQALTKADLVLVVGTSGIVQPAASLPFVASSLGTPVVEINPVETELSPFMACNIRATSAVALPELYEMSR